MEERVSSEIQIEDAVFDCRVDPCLMPAIRRTLAGTTPTDAEIDALPIPRHPIWLTVTVRALRWYRRMGSPRLGSRCVFEPSCSRYVELAFRKHGFPRGLALAVDRLRRCRPGSGGLDLP